ARFSPDRLRGLGMDPGATRRADRAREQIARILGITAPPDEPTPAQEQALRLAALAAFPDRVCKRRGRGSQELTFSSGTAGRLAEESCVRDAELLIALDAEER